MAIFTVHVPREAADPMARADATRLVRDGFSTAAFLFGPLYLIRHRAWLGAVAWVIAVVVGGVACHLLHLSGATCAALLLLAMLFTGLEASSVRRFALHRAGLDVAGVVGGRTLEEGERAFFGTAPAPMPSVAPGAPARPMRPPPTGVIGLFPGEGM